ncbi:MAG TPA: hypothetical protein VMS76_05350 [Planctomycetota bacterium]|nr:hypothetical protein [Planctomycetota bacterium]
MMKALAPCLCVLALGTLADRASAQSITTLFAHNNYGTIAGAIDARSDITDRA